MCGRYTLKTKLDQIARQMFLARFLPNQPPRYNIAPTQPVPVILTAPDGKREMRLMRWGLVPHWAKDISIGNKLINARVETLAQKPAFRDALKYRRCLIPADGFYEWQQPPGESTPSPPSPEGATKNPTSRSSRGNVDRPRSKAGGKQPYYITRPDGQPIYFAGLYEHWQDPHGNELETCTIITTDATPTLAAIHPRMPLILPETRWQSWLDPATPAEKTAEVINAAVHDAGGELESYTVSKSVNRATMDAPRLIEPTSPADSRHAGELFR